MFNGSERYELLRTQFLPRRHHRRQLQDTDIEPVTEPTSEKTFVPEERTLLVSNLQ